MRKPRGKRVEKIDLVFLPSYYIAERGWVGEGGKDRSPCSNSAMSTHHAKREERGGEGGKGKRGESAVLCLYPSFARDGKKERAVGLSTISPAQLKGKKEESAIVLLLLHHSFRRAYKEKVVKKEKKRKEKREEQRRWGSLLLSVLRRLERSPGCGPSSSARDTSRAPRSKERRKKKRKRKIGTLRSTRSATPFCFLLLSLGRKSATRREKKSYSVPLLPPLVMGESINKKKTRRKEGQRVHYFLRL